MTDSSPNQRLLSRRGPWRFLGDGGSSIIRAAIALCASAVLTLLAAPSARGQSDSIAVKERVQERLLELPEPDRLAIQEFLRDAADQWTWFLRDQDTSTALGRVRDGRIGCCVGSTIRCGGGQCGTERYRLPYDKALPTLGLNVYPLWATVLLETGVDKLQIVAASASFFVESHDPLFADVLSILLDRLDAAWGEFREDAKPEAARAALTAAIAALGGSPPQRPRQ